ncbi:hypothetical protein HMPREF1150_1334 [Streptococcus sp. AS14]|uniref:Sensory transduction histidine kinase n=2 Tax=Streptococcus sanguinis TaxID=1305 RepID=F3UPX1_STRSA|nr:sensory transduction histidine kinase [Streptococcus sanguinis SK408]EGJ42118.1 sensory transduction histidine kinase [Streptococcus sanguinis SK355]EJO19575.1 hypothetical protein HMPREF1150_1334 [Streptococcus sp. AS14]
MFIAFAGDFNQVLIRQQNAIAINYKEDLEKIFSRSFVRTIPN